MLFVQICLAFAFALGAVTTVIGIDHNDVRTIGLGFAMMLLFGVLLGNSAS